MIFSGMSSYILICNLLISYTLDVDLYVTALQLEHLFFL
jgi:hypothetical protein